MSHRGRLQRRFTLAAASRAARCPLRLTEVNPIAGRDREDTGVCRVRVWQATRACLVRVKRGD